MPSDGNFDGEVAVSGNTAVIGDIRGGDNGLSSGSAYVFSLGGNTIPVADAGADQLVTLVGSQVQLDGSLSDDDDGDTITYAWTLESRPVGSTTSLSGEATQTPTFIADVNGTYEISLVVTDVNGAPSTPDSVIVSFNNLQPVADAGGNQNAVVGDLVTLNGSGMDANNDPLTFSWMLTTQPATSTAVLSVTNTASTSFVADVEGNYIASLVVNDGIVDSVTSLAETLVITVSNDTMQDLMDVTDLINAIDEVDIKKNKAKSFTNKFNEALVLIADSEFELARDKLLDILKRTDGCANSGAPDKNDWVETCAEQGPVYDQLTETISQLETLF